MFKSTGVRVQPPPTRAVAAAALLLPVNPQPSIEAAEVSRAVAPGYPLAEAGPHAHPITPSNRRPVRRLASLMATPSPPRQLGVSTVSSAAFDLGL